MSLLHSTFSWLLALYRQALWGSMEVLAVRENVERKVLAAVAIQYVTAMSLIVLPVLFQGPRNAFNSLPHEQRFLTAGLVFFATVAFINTVWIVRCDLLNPVNEMESVATNLSDGRIERSFFPSDQRDEVGSLQASLADVHQYLQTVTAQAKALQQGHFDAPVFEREIPGPVGESLREMREELTDQIKQQNRELAANERALARFHRVTADTELAFEEQLSELLKIGCERLGTEYGYVAKIDTDERVQEIVAAQGTHEHLEPGETVPLEQAYCRRTVQSEGLKTFETPEEWANDPAHGIFGFGSYIGQVIVVDGELYGTFCFAHSEPRSFTGVEKTFVKLAALWASNEREREQRIHNLQVLFDQSPNGIVVYDTDGSIQQVNETLVTWLGYSPDFLFGKPVSILYDDLEVSELVDPLSSSEVGTTFSFEGDCTAKDGTTYPVEIWTNRINPDSTGELLAVIRDVTDRQDRLRQLQVMDRILRHNLRNKMTVVKGFTETIEVDSTQTEQYLQRIRTASDQLLETVNKQREIVSVLDERSAPTEQNVTDIVERVTATREPADPGLQLDVHTDESARVFAVPQLERAIDELVENAIIHHDHDTKTITVSVTQVGTAVRIEIRDDGPGIPQEESEILTGENDIEPLFHGSGLGLWLAHWIVKESSGTIEFSSNDPRGSIVTIELPSA